MLRDRKMNEAIELLSPVGDEAALHAAVCAGADAVYLGFSSFGARASATNFDAEALEKAIAYSHLYHVRVHVTVNTLVKQTELQAVYEALQTIAACRADAVIVQDMGVARIVREAFPTLALHASTQMALHTPSGARFAQTQGFARVVLARECTLHTIAQVAHTGVETEVFAHGALCSSVSGQCLMSSMAGGRSGNRGRCAQPCRQAVTLGDTNAALLSLRDLCLRDYLPELQQAGVTSLKIEGRLKRPEYVAVVTDSYRKALDAMAVGNFQPMDAQERARLLQVFHRGGFTIGHAMGAEDADLCSIQRVGHGGVAIGKIVAIHNGLATASLQRPLNDGDSLRIDSTEDVELRYSGHDALDQATLRLRPGVAVRVGDLVTRMADAKQLHWAQNIAEQTIPLQMRAEVIAGKPIQLCVSDGVSVVTVEGDIAQTAINRTLTNEDVARSLTKLGDSPFSLSGAIQIETEGAFAPVSTLNALRRTALEQLESKRRSDFFGSQREWLLTDPPKMGVLSCDYPDYCATQEPWKAFLEASSSDPETLPQGKNAEASREKRFTDTLAVSFADAAMCDPLTHAGANLLLFSPTCYTPDALETALPKLLRGTWLCLPPQMTEEDYQLALPAIKRNAATLGGLVLGSVGQLGFSTPLHVALGDGVPITNQNAARALLGRQIAFCTTWPELSAEEMQTLSLAPFPTLLRMYGRERLMLLNHCPERVARGLCAERATCKLCKPGDRACASPDAAIVDRKGYRFPMRKLVLPEGCVIEVLNALPTDLARQESQRLALGAGTLLSFTIETEQEQIAITQRFAALRRGGIAPPPDVAATSGHFLRGVE